MVEKSGWSPKKLGVQPFSSVCLVERAQMQVELDLRQQNETRVSQVRILYGLPASKIEVVLYSRQKY